MEAFRPIEGDLIAAILGTFGRRPDLRLWRAQPFAVRLRGRFARALPVGHPDIAGVLKPNGRAIYIEAKSSAGKLSEPQEAWRNMLMQFGALYILARSVEDVERCLPPL